jgi:hypothetical protein
MAADLDLLLVRLRELARAHQRLSRAVPDPATAAVAADAALLRVITLLDDPDVAGPLSELIPPARERVLGAADEFHAEFKERRSEVVAVEAKVTRRLGTTEEDIQRMYLSYDRARERRQAFPEGIEGIKRQLIEVHESTKLQIVVTRNMSRKEKKKRKRKIGQGIASAIFGTGVIAADTQMPVLFAFSYGLGGAALHQALRDIVGEEPD